MSRKCNNKGCYFSDEPDGVTMCGDCLKDYLNFMDVEALYTMYVDAVEQFKSNKYFRQQVRSIDKEMTNDYEIDCALFDQKMFEIVNSILLMKNRD